MAPVIRNVALADAVPAEVTTKEVDYNSLESLIGAVSGQDAVIDSTYSYKSESPRRLIDACVAASVYRYIPPEFGADPTNEAVRSLPFFRRKTETADHLSGKLRQRSAITCTAVACGPFLDALRSGDLGIDVKKKTITMFGDQGHIVSPFSTLQDIGKATAQVLLHPEETVNRVVYVSSVTISQRHLAELAKEALGPDGWQETTFDVQNEYRSAQGKVQRGEVDNEVIFALLRHSLTSQEYTYPWANSDNALLKVEEFSDARLKEYVREIAGLA